MGREIRHDGQTSNHRERVPAVRWKIKALQTLTVWVIVFAGTGLPGTYAFPIAAQAPVVERGSAERPVHLDDDVSGEPNPSPVTGFPIYDQALRLIRENYAEPLKDRQIFETSFRRLPLVLLPQCTEGFDFGPRCDADPEGCLLELARHVSEKCRMTPDQVLLASLNMLLASLDPNSCLLDPAMLRELTIGTSGKFGGAGMMVTNRAGEYVVIAPFEGSPAQKAGIRAGDLILEIDGRPVHGLPLTEVLRKVRGPTGSVMSLSVRDGRSGHIRRVSIRRRTIHIPPVRSMMLGNGVAYLRIVNFQEDTAAEVKKALRRMSGRGERGIRGLIIDLRDNPGGLFNEAIQVADLFLSGRPITSVRGRNAQFNKDYRASPKTGAPEIPLVILINRGTASASEILAGALQGRPQVAVMGEKSFGKASVQAVYPLGGGTALRLTTAHYVTADGRDIEGKGLEPDVIMDGDAEELIRQHVDFMKVDELTRDSGVRRAVDYLISEGSPARTPFSTLF
jgi:carboxyl-terminal processing protease